MNDILAWCVIGGTAAQFFATLGAGGKQTAASNLPGLIAGVAALWLAINIVT